MAWGDPVDDTGMDAMAQAEGGWGPPAEAAATSSGFRGYIPVAGAAAAQGVVGGLGKALSGIPELYSDKPEETTLGRYGKNVQDYAKREFPLSKEEQESVTGQTANIIGSAVPAIGAAFINPVAGVALGAAQMGLGSAAEAGEAARAKGASAADTQSAARWNAATGTALGVLPFHMILKPVQQAAPGLAKWATAKLDQAVKSGATFATVGEAQHWLANEIARNYYDPNAAYSFEAKRAIAGLVGGGILGAAAGRVEKPNTANLSPEQRAVLDRIGEPDKGWSMPGFHELYTDIKDDLHPIRVAEKELSPDGRLLPPETSPYIASRLTRGSIGRAEHFVEHGTFDAETGQNTGRSLQSILEPVRDNLDGLRAYMISRRAIELHDRGIDTGIPLAEAQQVVARGGNLAPVFNEIRQYQARVLDYLETSGIIGAEQRRAMDEQNHDYVPFYRLMDEKGQQAPGSAGPNLSVRNPIHGIRGSERQLLDPIESIVKNTYTFIRLADHNMARQKLEQLAQSAPNGGDIMQPVQRPVRPIEVTGRETERALQNQGYTVSHQPDPFTIFRPETYRPAPDEIAIFNDGKRSIYKVDPLLANALNGLDQGGMNILTKMLSAPGRMLRAGATLSPEFIVRNPIRDQFSALLYSALGRGYVPVYDFAKGLGSLLGKDSYYQGWLKSGGANSALVSIDRNYIQNLVGRLRDPSVGGTIKNLIRSPLELLRAASETMENATRIGEFRRLTQRGEGREAAGYGSREITLDFQRIGAKMRAANAMIPFMNAQIEGLDRTGRAFAANPGRFTAAAIAGITTPSVLLWYANQGDKRLDEIPRWQKDLFWIWPTNNWQPITPEQAARVPEAYLRRNKDGSIEVNRGTIWRIPKPFEPGILFGSIPERLLDAYVAKKPDAFKKLGETIWQGMTPGFVPQFAEPVIEQFANRSLFTGRPLVPKYLQDKLPSAEYNPYTTDSARLIGGLIGKMGLSESKASSPIIVENYIRSWTGGLGMHALNASDKILQGMGVVPSKVEPTLTAADKPIIKAFAVRFPEAGANSIQDFYEEYEKRRKAANTVKHLQRTGETESARQVNEERVLFVGDGLQKAISTQLKLVRDTWRNKSLTPQQKRDFIDMSYFQVIKMAQQGNLVFKQTKQEQEARRGRWGPPQP